MLVPRSKPCCDVDDDSGFFSVISRVRRDGSEADPRDQAVFDSAKECPRCVVRFQNVLAWWEEHDCVALAPRIASLAQRSLDRPIALMEDDDRRFFTQIACCKDCGRIFVDTLGIALHNRR